MKRKHMKRGERAKLAATIAFEVGVAVLALLLVSIFAVQWLAETQPAITLATDKEAYVLGDVVVFFGRSYNFPSQQVTFHLYIDRTSPTLHSEFDADFTANPPAWDFAVSWSPLHVGRFSAYVTGPNHTASREVEFEVVDPVPIPEFPVNPQAILIIAAAAAFATVTYRRRHG